METGQTGRQAGRMEGKDGGSTIRATARTSFATRSLSFGGKQQGTNHRRGSQRWPQDAGSVTRVPYMNSARRHMHLHHLQTYIGNGMG